MEKYRQLILWLSNKIYNAPMCSSHMTVSTDPSSDEIIHYVRCNTFGTKLHIAHGDRISINHAAVFPGINRAELLSSE
uniref:Uncharacterized protein n=1 Tax=Arundo donax TaxID=35708 RepID=A0A0A9A538_ARUDO